MLASLSHFIIGKIKKDTLIFFGSLAVRFSISFCFENFKKSLPAPAYVAALSSVVVVVFERWRTFLRRPRRRGERGDDDVAGDGDDGDGEDGDDDGDDVALILAFTSGTKF